VAVLEDRLKYIVNFTHPTNLPLIRVKRTRFATPR